MRLIIASAIFSFSLIAQQAGEYSLSGVVVNAQTGEPVKYALVMLTGFQAQESGKIDPAKLQPLQKSTQAGDAGEFRFTGLIKASYTFRLFV